MIQAGFGDVIGKITALADWELSRQATGGVFLRDLRDAGPSGFGQGDQPRGGYFEAG